MIGIVRLCLLVLALLAFGGRALAVPPYAPPGYSPAGQDLSQGLVTATGGKSARAQGDKAADTFNVMDYGARCDGLTNATPTDDSAAINAAVAAARASPVVRSGQQFLVESPPNRECYHTSTINLTGFTYAGGRFDLHLLCAVAGQPCVDALGSSISRFSGTIVALASPPSSGIMFGHASPTDAGGGTELDVSVSGYFSLAAIYCVACEGSVFYNLYAENSYSSIQSYAVVLDGYNHFNAKSQFVTVTDAVNNRISMNTVRFINGAMYSTGNANSSPLWVGGAKMLDLDNTYIAATANSIYGITLYQADQEGNAHLILHAHIEHQPNLKSCFYVTGTYKTPVFNSFVFDDEQAQCTTSVFATDPSLTSVAINDADINLTEINPASASPLFDNPALYSMSGTVSLPNLASWTQPASFTGTFCLANPNGPGSCVAYVPTEVANVNPDFALDQPNAGGAVQLTGPGRITDGWMAGGGDGASVQFQQSTASPPPGYGTYLTVSVPTAGTPGASQFFRMESGVEASDIAPWGFGTANAQSVTLDFCASGSAAATYAAYLQDAGRDQSYVVAFTLRAANVWQCFSNTIPGPQSGTWQSAAGAVGLRFGFALAAGSTYTTTASTWEAGEFYGASGANLTATGGATLKLGAVHLIAGPYNLPYKPRGFGRDLVLAQRFFRKSCSYGTACRQSAGLGAAGAATARSPWAGTSFGLLDLPVPLGGMFPGPTVTAMSTGAATGNCFDATTGVDAGAATVVNAGDAGATIQCALPGSVALGDQIQAQWTADSGL